MNASVRLLAALSFAGSLALFAAAGNEGAPAGPPKLEAGLESRLESLIAAGDVPDPSLASLEVRWREVLAESWKGEGSAALIARLEAIADDPTQGGTRRMNALRGLAVTQFSEGNLAEALKRADAGLAIAEALDLRWIRARLLDALDRIDDAIAAYEAVRVATSDPSLADKLALRIALLDAMKPRPKTDQSEATPQEEPESALHRLASQPGADPAFGNRAAIVLALLGKPKEAIDLYRTVGEGTDRFKQEIRRAEWALAAKDVAVAQEYAWNALLAAPLKRDRNYALTILTEAHRADASLPKLIERFQSRPDLDAESKRAWIDVLRETSRIDEALQLFRNSAGADGFTVELRRDLLEMCREAGRDEEVVATYRELIAEEPATLEWHEGMARHWLERGDRERAIEVWREYEKSARDPSERLLGARSASSLGLDEIAREISNRCLADPAGVLDSRMFRFDLELRAGRAAEAEAELDEFDRHAAPDEPQRVQLAEAYERMGRKKRAAEVLESLRAARGGDAVEEDLEMRLAWLLNETGADEKALERWKSLWERVSTIPRRRQVEDRLMATASRLGVLADIAVELEERLAEGKADERQAGLLIRLYQKVGDAVSAAEVVEEHLARKGVDQIEVLREKARVYLGGKDYYHFEKTVRKLVELDPENRGDHLRQLAMSNLERGRPQEARGVLQQLAEVERGTDAAEFEAGVLSLAGLNAEAAAVYRRGLAANPERIDTWLLFANTLRGMGRGEVATGMFQYQLENAEKDDLFTVAVDGVLNMRAQKPRLRHTLRVILERIATRHDKTYLYQLAGDVADELEDRDLRMRALENSLAIAGEQRAQVLRELMEVSLGEQLNIYTIVNGLLVRQRQGGDDTRRLAYGRRLIGLGDIVPPQVYLELGEAFLRSGDVGSAAKTFALAREIPDRASFERQIAKSFENEKYLPQALTVYERSMASQAVDVWLLLKVGELHEQMGHDSRAAQSYRRGIEILLARHPLVAEKIEKKEDDENSADYYYRNRNVGDYERWFTPLVTGFLVTASDEEVAALFAGERELLVADLASAPRSESAEPRIASHPRIQERSEFLRGLALRTGRAAAAAEIDRALLERFRSDPEFVDTICDVRLSHGQTLAARDLVERSALAEADRVRAFARLGIDSGDAKAVGLSDAMARLLPLIVGGETDRARDLMRRVVVSDAQRDQVPALEGLFLAATYLEDSLGATTFASHAVRALVKHGQGYEDSQRVDAILRRARAAIDAESFGLVVDAMMSALKDKKDAFSQYAYTLREIQGQVGRPLFTGADLAEMIEGCLPDQHYLVASLVGLAAKEERAKLIATVLPKVPPSSQTEVAVDVLGNIGDDLTPEVGELLLGTIKRGIDKVDEPLMLVYSVREGMRCGPVAMKYVEQLAALLAERFPSETMFTFAAACARRKIGASEGTFDAISDQIESLTNVDQEWNIREMTAWVNDSFTPEEVDELVRVAFAILDRGYAVGPARFIRFIAEKREDQELEQKVLARGVEQSPDSVDAVREVYFAAARRGDVVEQVRWVERLFELAANDWRNAVITLWRGLDNPLRALAAGKADAPQAVESTAPTTPKVEDATLEVVKREVEAGRHEIAKTIYRRTWRAFGSNADDGFSGVIYYYGGDGTVYWPEAQEAESVESRGGLFDVERTMERTFDRFGGAIDAVRKSRPVHDVIAEQPFGLAELRRQIRQLEPSQIQDSRSLVNGLAKAEVAVGGEAAVCDAWRAAIRDGTGGVLERSLLLSRLEARTDQLSEADLGVLDELLPAVRPLDGSQLRALARLYRKQGDATRAARLYQWCATLATTGWRSSGEGAISAFDLIDEVAKNLTGDERDAAVAAILRCANPGGEPWEREEYVRLVLETWRKLHGPAAALERCAAEVEAILDPRRGLLRDPAILAANLLAQAGDFDRALRAVEVGICKLDVSQVTIDERLRFNAEYLLAARQIYGNGYRDLVGGSDAPLPQEWTKRLAEKLLEWGAAGRLSRTTEVSLSALLSTRCLAANDLALANRLFARIEQIAKSAHERLFVVDVARRLGDEACANAVEDELLADHRLHSARLADVVDRVAATQGAAAALAVGAAVTEYRAPKALLERLIAHATEAGDIEQAVRWQERLEESARAADQLDFDW
jgi:hypothetical protein